MKNKIAIVYFVALSAFFMIGNCFAQSYVKISSCYFADFPGGTMHGNGRQEVTYDSAGHVAKCVFGMQSSDGSTWTPSMIRTSTYNSQGQELSSLTTSLNKKSDAWENSQKQIFSYNDKGQLTQNVSYNWRELSGKFQWVNDAENVYTYDDNGNMLTSSYLDWKDTAWANVNRDHYESGERDYTEKWDEGKKIWVKQFMNNNDSTQLLGKVVVNTFYKWNEEKQEWAPGDRFLYHYGDSGHAEEMVYQSYNPNSKAWGTSMKEFYQYDDKGNYLGSKGYEWSSETKNWELFRYCEEEYKYPEKKAVAVVPKKDAVVAAKNPTVKQDSISTTKISAAPPDLSENDLLISPNPASDSVSVTRGGNSSNEMTVTIFNPNGGFVKELKLKGTTAKLSVKGLSPGTYSIDVVCEADNIYILKNLYVER